MPGQNCAFFGCPTSRKHGLSLFKIPSVRVDESEVTKVAKRKAREEWLRLILRTREMTPDLKKRIEANNIFVCERHFKPESILTSKFLAVVRTVDYLHIDIVAPDGSSLSLITMPPEQRLFKIINI